MILIDTKMNKPPCDIALDFFKHNFKLNAQIQGEMIHKLKDYYNIMNTNGNMIV